MGKLPQGMLGSFQGKIGVLVGSTWKGIPYVKTKPERKAKRGVEEKKNQTRFADLHYWLQPIIGFLRVGFKGYSPTVEGFIAAKSYALKHAYTIEDDNKVFDPSLVKVSYGDLPLPEKIEFEKKDDNSVQFTWDLTRADGASSRDQVMLLAYAPDEPRGVERTSMELTGQFRENGADTLRLSTRKGAVYHLYIAFIAYDRSRQSDSRYLGTITT